MIFMHILDLAGPDRNRLVLSILFKFLDTLFAMLPLGIAYFVVLALFGDGDDILIWGYRVDTLPGISLITAALLLAYGGQWLFFWASNINAHTVGYRMAARLRMSIADHFRKAPFSYYKKNDTGQLANVVMQDVMGLEQMPGLILPRMVSALFAPILAISVCLVLDWRVGLALFAGLPLAIPALIWGHKGLGQISRDYAASSAKMNGRLIEFVRGIDVLKSLDVTDEMGTKCEQAVSHFRDASKALTYRYVIPTIVFPFLLLTGCSGALMVGAYLFDMGEVSVAAYIMTFLIGLRLYTPLLELMDFSALTHKMETALARVQTLLDAPTETDFPNARVPDRFDITFEDVSFRYPDGDQGVAKKSSLQDVSFSVPAGSVTAIVGETGSGKTTIARLLCGDYAVDQGSIEIGGAPVHQIPRKDLCQIVSVVSQDVFLFTETVRDNICLGRPDAREDDIIAAAKMARCHEFISGLPQGYDTVLMSGAAQLSGGERQRISLARAFLLDSPILVLDEVTSALDVENERLLQQALGELVKDKTVIVIAHRLWTIKDVDQILLLEAGRIIERGQHDMLLEQSGRYASFWHMLRQAPGWNGNLVRDQV